MSFCDAVDNVYIESDPFGNSVFSAQCDSLTPVEQFNLQRTSARLPSYPATHRMQ
jgi:hypothetical protein